MNCEEFKIQLRRWLVSSMERERQNAEPPAEILDHARHCTECRPRLNAALIAADLPAHQPPVPEDLAERVKTGLRERVLARDRQRFGPTHRRLMQFATAAALLVVAVVSGVFLGRVLPGDTLHDDQVAAEAASGGIAAEKAEATAERIIRVEFRLEAPNAQIVSVVGDWNGWDATAHPLSDSDGRGIWTTTITLQPEEEYQYQFLIDGRIWIPDPTSPLTVDDGFGGTNSVLNI